MARRLHRGCELAGVVRPCDGEPSDVARVDLGQRGIAAAEDVADNNYPTTPTTYRTGCDIGGTGCHGSITLPWTVAVAERVTSTWSIFPQAARRMRPAT